MSKARDIYDQKTDDHPLLPSGAWEGFYCYHDNAEQHVMQSELVFAHSKISGSGIDDVASFVWKGKYDLQDFKASFVKLYNSHKVWYNGDIDENGIWGLWHLDLSHLTAPPDIIGLLKESFKNQVSGGFHIWPKKQKEESNSLELSEEKESKILRELFLEVFA